MNELDNQKNIYLELLEKVNLIIKKINDIVNDLDTLDNEFLLEYTVNDLSGDNKVVKNNQTDIIQMRNILINNVIPEINEHLSQINQLINYS